MELVNTHGLGPCTARLAGSTPVPGTFTKIKLISTERNINQSPTSQEVLVRIEDIFDQLVGKIDEKITKVEGWKTQVQPGTNERKDQTLRHWHETIKLVTELRKQIRSIFQTSNYPTKQTQEN